MEFDDAKNGLKNLWVSAGLEVVDEHERELFLKHPREGVSIHVPEAQIVEYAEWVSKRPAFVQRPVECSICSPDYREHAVDLSAYDPRRVVHVWDRTYLFGEQSENELYGEVGTASKLFVGYFAADEAYVKLSLERMQRPFAFAFLARQTKKRVELQDLFYKPYTIKIYNLRQPTVELALQHSAPIIDACLFELSYLKGVTLTLQEEWPRRQPRVRPFYFGNVVEGNQLPLPRVTFGQDTIRFYQRGMSTADPVNQFLSFYHVLEYHFLAVANEQLYGKLCQRINDPRFSTTPTDLDHLIADILEHNRETDETEMLKLVLRKYVDEAELIEFLRAYEQYMGESFYSKRRSVFGDEIEIKLVSGHAIANVAKRIRTVRNAIVHSSDTYERKERYIPTASAEKAITREIPLMKYLAEKVLIGSAK